MAAEQQCSGGLPHIPQSDPVWSLCDNAALAYEVYEATRLRTAPGDVEDYLSEHREALQQREKDLTAEKENLAALEKRLEEARAEAGAAAASGDADEIGVLYAGMVPYSRANARADVEYLQKWVTRERITLDNEWKFFKRTSTACYC